MLHIAKYYKSVRDLKTIQAGFTNVCVLIDRIKPNVNLPPEAFAKPSLTQKIGHLCGCVVLLKKITTFAQKLDVKGK